jgi:CHASE2 domain-containing sensor protein
MVRLESDGNVRRYISGDDGKGGRIPGLATLLAGKQPPSDGSYFLDFGIRPDSVPRISYVDVLTGNFREASLKDKTIIIGAMADELGDQIAVPVHGVLPGPLVHALAFESLFQGRDIYGRTVLFILMTAFLLIMSTGRLLERRPHLPG